MTQDELDNSYVRITEDEDGQRWLQFPDEPFTINRAVSCHRCGYNLIGLQADNRCPECGAPIAISLAGSTLVVSDPDWMRRILRGAKLMIYSPLIVGISAIPQVLVQLIPEAHRRLPQAIFLTVMLAALVASAGVAACGIWMFTTRHSHLILTNSRLVRPAIRMSALCVPVTIALVIVDGFMRLGIGLTWIVVLGSPFGLIGAIGAYTMCNYCRGIARAILDEETPRHVRQYCWCLTIGYGCGGVTALMVWLNRMSGGPIANSSYLMISIVFGFVAVFVLFIFGALIYMLPHLLVKQLKYCSDASQFVWDRAMHEPQAEDEPPRE